MNQDRISKESDSTARKEDRSEKDPAQSYHSNEPQNTASACVVLIKKIPVHTTEEEVKESVKHFGKILRVKLLKHKSYAYVEFEKAEYAKKCVEYYTSNTLTINDAEVLVYLTSSGKNENKPLDLNPPSNILLLTFFKNKVEINIQLVLDMMEEFDVVEKVGLVFC